MATISSLGAGSGMDLNGIVQKLMSVEQQPLFLLASKEASAQAKISALGSLKSAIEAISGSASSLAPSTGKTAAEFFTSTKAAVAGSEYASATATLSAAKGSYSLEVVTLAQAHRLATLDGRFTASTDTVLDGGFTTGSMKIEIGANNAGTFVAKSGTTPITINIDASNNTLAGLRDAINGAKAGVTAAIITGDTGPKLVLTSNEVGTGNLIKLSDVSGMSGFDYDPIAAVGDYSESAAQGGQTAQSAVAKINGITVTSATNTLTDAISGVTLTLLKQTTSPTTINITKDNTLATSLGAFVKIFNDSVKTMRELGKFTEGSTNNGPLLGNAALRNVQNRLRSLITSTPTGIASSAAVKTLSDIGIGFEKDGSLKLDSVKLGKAIETNQDAVVNLVAAFGVQTKAATADSKGLPGIVSAATDGLNSTIKGYNRQRELLSQRLTGIEERYRKQFSIMDSLVANLNKTASYLQQQLANLPGSGSR